MVLGCGFESRLHLKTRWKDGPLDGRKSNEKINVAKYKMGQSTQKKHIYVKENSYFFLSRICCKKSQQGKDYFKIGCGSSA